LLSDFLAPNKHDFENIFVGDLCLSPKLFQILNLHERPQKSKRIPQLFLLVFQLEKEPEQNTTQQTKIFWTLNLPGLLVIDFLRIWPHLTQKISVLMVLPFRPSPPKKTRKRLRHVTCKDLTPGQQVIC